MSRSNARLICCAILGQPNLGLRCFMATTASISSCDGPLGPGLRRCFSDEYSSLYLRFLRMSWSLSSVDGLVIIASRRIRRTLRKSDKKPSKNRSSTERLCARCRERLMTSSCCFINTLSATTALAPPGPMSLASIVRRWMRRAIRSFIGEEDKADRCLGQDSQDFLSPCFHSRS